MNATSSQQGPRPLPGAFAGYLPVEKYESPKARAFFYQPRRDLLVSQMVGHIDRGLAEAWKAFGERTLVQGIAIRVFHDWEAVTGYESEARTLLTSWSLDRRTLIKSVVVLTQSKMVAMGVATANLATSVVGLQMHSHTQRATFEKELEEALARR